MIYHGGIILPGVTVKAIFWGPSWATYTGDKISGMDKWYSYVGTVSGGAGSSYEATVNEYTDSATQQVTTAVTQSTVSGESQGLAALANVSGHELSETRSDPNGNAWYASNGNENGDNCAWTFGGSYVTFLDGTKWKIQGNWSNAANDGTSKPGYTTSLGTGCVDGTNYPGPYTQ